MRILITGSNGFIGRHLGTCLRYDHEIIDFDIRDSLEYDLTNRSSVQSFWTEKRPDIVVHLAANPRAGLSQKYPVWNNKINVEGTINVLQASLENSVELFIYTSTCQVYDVKAGIPMDETSPCYPRTPYAISKYAGEFYCKNFDSRGLNTCVLRFFNVYGAGQSRGYVIPDLIFKAMAARRKVKVLGPPDDSRDFIYVTDLVEAIKKVIDLRDEVSGQTINLGSGLDTSIGWLCDKIGEALKKKLIWEFGERPFGRHAGKYRANISKAKALLGWEPKISLDEGLKLIISGSENVG